MPRPLPRLPLLSVLLATTWAAPVWAKTDLSELSLEQLLDVTITAASKYAQRQDEVAAAASVLTRAEIKAFGWRARCGSDGPLPQSRRITFATHLSGPDHA